MDKLLIQLESTISKITINTLLNHGTQENESKVKTWTEKYLNKITIIAFQNTREINAEP